MKLATRWGRKKVKQWELTLVKMTEIKMAADWEPRLGSLMEVQWERKMGGTRGESLVARKESLRARAREIVWGGMMERQSGLDSENCLGPRMEWCSVSEWVIQMVKPKGRMMV
jgi:hypothetical protein